MSTPVFSLSHLDGNNGFRLNGVSLSDAAGTSVSNAGDVNGDGFADVIIGNDGNHPWYDYVVFGQSTGFDATMNLSSLNGNNGFRLDNVSAGGNSGRSSVSNAGDINGDGFDDVIVIGAPNSPYSSTAVTSGYSHVVFGKPSGFDAAMDVSRVDGKNGFTLVMGNDVSDWIRSVSNAGDMNGDGFADVIVGGFKGIYNVSYVVFGQSTGFAATIDLSSLDGDNGFRLDGALSSHFGTSVSSAGDINGDGYDDMIVGAPFANPNGNHYPAGSSYVVFGRATGFDAAMNVSNLDGNNGFRLDGEYSDYAQFGESVSTAGDVNGDGFDDVIIGIAGTLSYVMFGKASGFDAAIDLSNLDGSDGFRMVGGGKSVSSAGDVNGDGFDDLIIGSGEIGYSKHNGYSYVVFGKASGFDAQIDLSNLDSQSGFRIDGENDSDDSGASVSGAGDVNGDGFDDLLVGAPGADPNGDRAGASYIIFGASDVVGGGLPVIFGTSGDDHLEGTPAAEHFDAGDGNDILLGGGGADQLVAGSGDDNIAVPDLGFAILEGGAGRDMLQLQGDDLNLDLTQSHNLSGIETLDLGTGGNKLVVTAKTLQDLSDINLNEVFTIRGDSSAQVSVRDDGWYDLGGSGTFHDYLHNGMLLQVDNAVQVDFAVSPAAVFDLNSLDGQNGFQLLGEGEYDGSGATISSAGDVNGDGFDDVIIGTRAYSAILPNDTYKLSTSYVVFGQASGFDSRMNLSTLDGKNGFRMQQASTQAGAISVGYGAGDVNGDGFDDVIVGVSRPDAKHVYSWDNYVVFGKASGFDAQLDLEDVNADNGFRLSGGDEFYSITPLGSAGDINGDGFDDVILKAIKVGAEYSLTNFVVFGKSSGLGGQVDLAGLDGLNGFRLENGNLSEGNKGTPNFHSAGDVNGDGIDDLLVELNRNIPSDSPGSDYVVFGKTSGFDAQLDLSSLDGSNGFRVDGDNRAESLGYSARSAGDINGDGFGDIVIDVVRKNDEGERVDTDYVIFGKASGFDAVLTLSSLDGSNGFRLNGNASLAYSNFGASSAGDINGDGFDDLIVGDRATGVVSSFSGTSYVVFGKASGFDAQIDVAKLDDKNVLRLMGNVDKVFGTSNPLDPFTVSAAGDINSDGFDDLLLGDQFTNPNGTYSGTSNVIFGNSDFGQGGDGGGLPEIKGTDGDDTLKGTTAAELFKAGDGNDKMIGRGGADEFHGEDGNDFIQVLDLGFGLVDGGAGNDVLHLDGKDLNLDLTNYLDHIQSIETICLYGRGDNTLSLTGAELKELSDTTDTLRLHGNAGDQVILEGEWADGGSHGFYHTYTQDDAVVLVGMNMTAVIA